MDFTDEYSNWLLNNTKPNSKFRGAGYEGLLDGANKTLLSPSYRQMGNNSATMDLNNAMIGKNQPQTQSMNWNNMNFGGGSSASNTGLAVAAPSVSMLQEAIKSGLPIEDVDFSKVISGGSAPFGVVKALASGVPMADIDWGKAVQGDPVSGVAASLVGPTLGSLTGSKVAGDVAGAGVSTGLAALQGFTNPLSDLQALAQWTKLLRGLF